MMCVLGRKYEWESAAFILVSVTGYKTTVGIYDFLPLYQHFSYLGFILSGNSVSGRAKHFQLPTRKF